MATQNSSGVQALDRALDIIEQLAQSQGELSIAQLSQRTGLAKSTVHRILSTFTQRGYVEKDPENSMYFIGQKFVQIASVYLSSINLKTEAGPSMHEVASFFDAVCYLGILKNNEVMYLEKIEKHYDFRVYTQIGKQEPLHCTGLGKMLLAGLEEDVSSTIIHSLNMVKYTANTITDPEDLMLEVAEAKRNNYALDRGEHTPQVSCVAVPIYDYMGTVVAAMSVSAPNLIKNYPMGTILSKLQSASQRISGRLGHVTEYIEVD